MQTVNLDLSVKNVVPLLHAKQGEVGRKFKAILTDSGSPYTPPSGAVVSVWFSGASGEGNYTDIGTKSAISISGNEITVEMITQMLTRPGDGKLCLVINSDDGTQLGAWNIPYACEVQPGLDSPEAKEYYTAFSKAAADLADAAKTFMPDETLSKRGYSADAAATGNAIALSEYNLSGEIAIERARIDNLVANTGESTEGNSELPDIRVGYNGEIYETAGSAVRSQIGSIQKSVGGWFYTKTAVARYIDVIEPVRANEYYACTILEWTGESFQKVSVNGIKEDGSFETILNNTATIGSVFGFQTKNAYKGLRISVNTSAVPTTAQTLTVKLVKTAGETIASTLYRLDRDARRDIADINQEIAGIVRDFDVFCPTVYAVVGEEMNIYYHNIFKADNLDNYEIKFTSRNPSSGEYFNVDDFIRAMEDGIRITAKDSNVGQYTITILVIKNSVTIAEYPFTLNVVAKNIPNVKAIFIGDSITNQGFYTAQIKDLMGDKLTTYGTKTSQAPSYESWLEGKYDVSVNHEGRGGWTSGNYANDASATTENNPFYNNGFNFAHYIQNNPTFSDVTDVFILLGTNDSRTAKETVASNLQKMINSIKAYRSSIRVHIGLPIPPAKDRYAQGNITIWNHKNAMWDQCKYNFENLQNCFFVPYNVCIDTWYGWSREETQVAAHLKDKVMRPADWLHPSYGAWQMGDAAFADIIANCQ